MSEAEEGASVGPDRVDPRLAAVDAALDREDPDVGTEVVKLVFASDDFGAVARMVERALRVDQAGVRQPAHVAVGDLARISGRLTPGIYAALRAEGLGGAADSAIKDVLTFIPFRRLPWWFRWTLVRLTVRNLIQGWWLRAVDAFDTARDAWRARPDAPARATGDASDRT